MAEAAKWYVVHTYSGYENKVAQDLATMVENRRLQDLICDIKVPTEMVPELKTKKVTAPKTVEIYAFDEFGYVFEDFVVTITPATTNINLEVLVDGKFTNVNGKTLELEAGRLLTVQANSDPDGAYGNYTWKITNPGYACLRDEVGDEELSAFEGCYALVDGLTPGKTVTLTATAMDGSGKKATVKIKVVEPAEPQ